MSSKQIRVGQRWRRHDRSEVKIVSVDCVRDSFGCVLNANGKFFIDEDRDHAFDLVELIEDAPGEPQPQASTPFTVGMEGVTTRDGRNVRILCVDRKCADSPILSLIESCGCEYITCHGLDGRVSRYSEYPSDLMPPAPPKQYVWMNVYEADDGTLKSRQMSHPSKESADKMAVSGRVGRMKVELEARWDE